MFDSVRGGGSRIPSLTTAGASPEPPVAPNPGRFGPRDEFVTLSALPRPAVGAAALPKPVATGSLDYYRQRYADFVARNPGATPPSYYLSYGDKYVHRFAALGPKDLSPEGLAWRDRCLKNLQDAIETKRAQDPQGFAQLERNDQAFTRFCYDSHPKAYLDAGLLQLPAEDLVKIATTPDTKDLLGPGGIKQVLSIIAQARPADFVHILEATAKDELREHFHLPHFPFFSHASAPWALA